MQYWVNSLQQLVTSLIHSGHVTGEIKETVERNKLCNYLIKINKSTIDLMFLIYLDSSSVAITNKNGERGHPCQTPRMNKTLIKMSVIYYAPGYICVKKF